MKIMKYAILHSYVEQFDGSWWYFKHGELGIPQNIYEAL